MSRESTLHGQVALVMGASRGIGAAAARELARQGAAVMLVSRSQPPLETLARAIRADGGSAGIVVADLANQNAAPYAVAATLQHFGRLDHLINNAAVIEPVARIASCDPGLWAQTIRMNLGGLYQNCRAALPVFEAAGKGVIVTLSSGAAHRAVDGWSAYCASKAASLMLMRTLALESKADLRLYAFQPGAVDTDMLANVRAAGLSEYSARARDTLLPPELPARTIAYLCRERPPDLSGQELTIRDPGLRARAELPERDYT